MTELATDAAGRDTTARQSEDLDRLLEQHRAELTAYCYRMLGSAFEAEDAVQETMLRAWRNFDRFEGRATLRTWLYRIATNVCLDMLNGSQRRARPMDLTSSQTAAAPLGDALPEATWIQPMPDSRVLEADGDPAELAVVRDSVRLAFTVVSLPEEALRAVAADFAKAWSERTQRGVSFLPSSTAR